jgi:ADP-heptose:LPS heptosyltransferase
VRDGLVPGVERIAVLRANGLGDWVFVLPALDALRAAYPRAEIVLLGTAMHAELLRGRPGPVDRVEVVPAMAGIDAPGDFEGEDAEAIEAFFARLRAERFDLALQMHGGGRYSNPFVNRLGARVTAGARTPDAAPLDRELRYGLWQRETVRWWEVAALVGAPPSDFLPRLAVTDRDRAQAAAALPEDGDPRPLAVLHPGASDARRRWPPEGFAEVGRALAARGLRVATIGEPPAERALAARVAAGVPGAVDLGGRLSLPALVGLLARARLVVGNDSGPLHVAEAAGTATVGIYWCGNLITADPLTRADRRPVVAWRLHCPECGAHCIDPGCPHDPSFVADVAVEEVLDAALDLLAQPAAPRRLAAA